MADVLVVLLIVGFFALCAAFVRGCDRIIGPDDAQELEPSRTEAVTTGEPVEVGG